MQKKIDRIVTGYTTATFAAIPNEVRIAYRTKFSLDRGIALDGLRVARTIPQ
jgi:hypothetical protein